MYTCSFTQKWILERIAKKESHNDINIGGEVMNTQYICLTIGIVGILGAIVPAAQMGTEIYFDFQLFMLVIGIGVFYVIGSGGAGLKILITLVKVHLLQDHLVSLLLLPVFLALKDKL